MDQTPAAPPGHDHATHQSATFEAGLVLDCGVTLAPVTLAYRTYGTLSTAADNAVLVCHALTGDQYVAEDPSDHWQAWLVDRLVGPGLPIDTDRFFVICLNVLGGCMGSTGRARRRSRRHGTETVGHRFPAVTIRDMVRRPGARGRAISASTGCSP